MTKSETGKKYFLIAAICYMVLGLYSIVARIFISHSFVEHIVSSVIFWIATIGMATALFMKNKKAVVAAAGVKALYVAYYTISSFSLSNLCDFIAYAGAVVLIVLSIKGNSAVKEIWFIPALAQLVSYIIDWILWHYFRFHYFYWKTVLFALVEIAGLLFTGMWIKGDATSAQAAPTNEYATFDPHTMHSAPASTSAIGGADKLKMYKELLDSGAITQEEFDAKKQQILGL